MRVFSQAGLPAMCLPLRVAGAVLVVLCAIAAAHPATASPYLAPPAASQNFNRTWPFEIADDASFSISGTVSAVDYDANQIVVSSRGSATKITITPTTSIEVRGESGSISDIRRGSRVNVSGVIRDDVHVAQTIVIR